MSTARAKALIAAAKEAAALDARDSLASYRSEFAHPAPVNGNETVYLCGNSLGLMPIKAAQRVKDTLSDWGEYAVRGHFEGEHPWMPYHHEARHGLARLCGALDDEVVAMNTLTLNLHLMMVSFYRPEGRRRKILIERDAFPSDRFAVRSQIFWHGNNPDTDLIEWRERDSDGKLYLEDLESLLDEHGAEIDLMLLPGVQYYSGQVLDIEALSQLAKRHGIRLGLDLAHAIGNVELQLHDLEIDFAAFCTYKYLNSGPGAIGGVFVHQRHFATDGQPRLLGWWGNNETTRFKMAPDYDRAPGANAWQLSNQPILALAPLMESLELFSAAGMPALRKKSVTLTAFLERLLDQHFSSALASITPRNANERGCQLSLVVNDPKVNARKLFKTLEAQNVIGDWREPNVIRVAPTPLYNRFSDAVALCQNLDAALAGSEA
ncbi:MAG: kynureninase [Pseudomonadota bacterium]